MLAIILVTLLAVNEVSSATITQTDYRLGSRNGGTILRIDGSGFAENPLDETGGNQVYMESSSQRYTCDVEKDGTSATTITCTTRPMPYGIYDITVYVNDVLVTNVPAYFTFEVNYYKTPLLTYISPLSSTPGSLVTFSGRLFTNKTQSSQAEAANGATAAITRVWITGKKCSLFRDTDELYGASLNCNDDDECSNWGTFQCLHNGNYVSSQNGTFMVDEDYGRCLPDPSIMRISSDYRLYNYQTYAVIDDVSPAQGSIHGGTVIEITGNYLYDSSIEITVGGEPCTNPTWGSNPDTSISCTTPERGTRFTDAFPGSRGVFIEIYDGLVDKSAIDNVAYEDYAGGRGYRTDRATAHFFATSLPVVTRMRGFFVPAKDGTYSFSADGDSDVYVSTDQTMTNKKLSPGEVTLSAGEYYYFEVVHTESNVDEVRFSFKAYLQETDYTSNQTGMAKQEKQTIVTSSPEEGEIQQITLTNWESDTDNATNEVLELCISCKAGATCESIVEFTLTLHGITAQTMLSIYEANLIKFWIEQFPTLGGDRVSVVKSDNEDCDIASYNITVESARGSLPLEATPVLPNVTAVVTVLTASKPSLSSFTLAVVGTPSGHATVGDTSSLASAVRSVFGTGCPRALESELGAATFFIDFESYVTGSELYGGTVTAEDSYCGTNSIKKPTRIDFGISFDSPKYITDYLQLCLAHKGALHGTLEYKYFTDDEYTARVSFSREDTSEWSHTCTEVSEILQANYASNLPITSLVIELSFSDDDFFADNVFFGDVYIAEADLNALKTMRRPPLGGSLRLENVEVTYADDVYMIEMLPIDCAIGLPLLEVAYATMDGAYSAETWGNSSITVELVQLASPPVGGTFSLTLPEDRADYGGTLSGIAWNVEAAELEARLEELNGVSDVYVTRSGTCRGYTWEVEFISPAGRHGELSATGSFENTDANISSSVTTHGGIYLDPLPGDWTRVASKYRNVEIIINNVPSLCQGNCSFEYDETSTPAVTGASVSEGTVTIQGDTFSATAAENGVTIGGVDCPVASATENTITCTLGNSPGGMQDLVVLVAGSGNSNLFGVEVPLTITGIDPSTGSEHGGTRVTITGTGFSDGISVTIGDSQCEIESVSYTTLQCDTSSGDGEQDVVVMAGSENADGNVKFTFAASTAVVTGISGTGSLTVLGGSLIISGSGFGADSTGNAVYIGETSLTINSWSDSEINATAPSLDAGTYPFKVNMQGFGNADVTGFESIEYVLRIDSVTPQSSSLLGGLNINIIGERLENAEMVTIGENECEITGAEDTLINCKMDSCGKMYYVENSGTSAYGTGYAWSPEKLTINVGDTVTWRWTQLSGLNGAEYQVHTTASASSFSYDDNGFSSGPQTASGSYTYRFDVAGKYYIGGHASTSGNIFMRGVITVEDAVDTSNTVTVHVGGYTAHLEDAMSCQDALTPTITSISPDVGTSETDITITGTGFTATSTSVTVGDAECTVESSSDTTVTCKVGIDTELSIGLYHEVRVFVDGRGYSRSSFRNLVDRSFVLQPIITSVSPAAGSLNGGTTLTIQGGGLSDATEVTIQGIACEIESASYSEITCVTGESSAGTHNVDVWISGRVECSETCTFEYSQDATPTVDSVSLVTVTKRSLSARNTRSSDAGTRTIRITGTGYTDDVDSVSIFVGVIECTPISVSSFEIDCEANGIPVGSHTCSVRILGKGNADFGDNNQTITIAAVISSMDINSGSVLGGAVVTVFGEAFLSGETVVTLGGNPADIISVTLERVEFRVPEGQGSAELLIVSNGIPYPIQTFLYLEDKTPEVTDISPTSGEGGVPVILTISSDESLAGAVVTIGGVDCKVTDTLEDSVTCTLGERYGGDADIVVLIPTLGYARIDPLVTFSYTFYATSVSPDTASLGGRVVTISGVGMSNNATVLICNEICTLLTSVTQTSTSLTCLAPPSDSDRDCDVVVRNSDVDSRTVSTEQFFSYSSELTPTVDSVSPQFGGTAGGTFVTIAGSKFGTDPNDVLVKINGVECAVSTVVDGLIFCTTGDSSTKFDAQVEIEVGGNRNGQTSATFHYVDRWSSVSTWGNTSPPVEGDFVVIGEEHVVLFDVVSPKLVMLLIQGTLIFAEEDSEVHLNAENILITHGGKLQIGTESEPYQGKARITMHGHLRSPELPVYGAKTLGVREGTLEMHGKVIDTTWTLLDETAEAGATQITLQVPVTWEVNDKIVIASTGLRHSQRENEERVISAISSDKRTLTLSEPLEYRHLGVSETYLDNSGETKSFEYRAEVGLLSRNIVFEGSDDVSWHDEIEACPDGFDTGMFATQTCFQGRFGEEEGSDEFGGSIMIHSPSIDNPTAIAHIEYVELNYVGQAFRLGRYPIHWHLMGDMSQSYVRGCAIHKSFNRAVTIHNTHNLLVERNVIYNIMGGAFFIEDGIETGNIVQYNLAVFVKQSTSLLNDDITPAAYWVTNPNNTIQHNHAAGGTHFGYWYRMREHPEGPSYTTDICQRNVELGVFQNNTAHSQGWFGLWIFQKYFPKEGGGCGSTTPAAAVFKSLTAWHCEKGAEWVEGGAIQFDDFRLSSNELCGLDLKLVIGTEWSKNNGALVKNNVIIGESAVTGEDYSSYGSAKGIILPFASKFWVDRVRFINFNNREGQAAFGITEISGTCSSLCGGFHYLVQGMSFINTEKRIIWRWPHEGIFYDLDGSFSTKGAGGKVVPYSPIYDDGSDCEETTGPMFGHGISAVLCEPSVRFHRLAINNIFPTSLQYKELTLINSYGNTTSEQLKKRLTHKQGWMFVLRSQETYTMEFAEGAEQFTNLSFNSHFYDFVAGDYVIMKVTLTQTPDRVFLNGEAAEVGNTTLVTEDSDDGEWHYNVNNGELAFMVQPGISTLLPTSSDTSYAVESSVVTPNIYRCFYPNCQRVLLSDTTLLPESHEIPADAISVTELLPSDDHCMNIVGTGDNMAVEIPDDCSIIWKVPSSTIHVLHIKPLGNVYFDNAYSVNLSATYIVSEGRFVAGFSTSSPLRSNLRITLRGSHSTLNFETESGVSVPPKCLACFGTCQIHGQDTGETWVSLRQTAGPGSTSLFLSSQVTWESGTEIVITPTGYNAWHAEKRIITNVAGDTLTLNEPLEYEHIADNINGIDLSAKVGLLTRTITIESELTTELMTESYGAFVLVSSTGQYTAQGKFSNIEFYHSGQEGFYDAINPRHSISFLNAAEDGYVIECAFHDGFSPAIGVYQTQATSISLNVIHHTVNEAIVITGESHNLESNLVVLNIFRGSYQDRFEDTNYEYTSAINVENTRGLFMIGNVVAGAERIGYRIPGVHCNSSVTTPWNGNSATATLIGVWFESQSDYGGCSSISGFTIYKAWDIGIYHQTPDSVEVSSCNIIDCTVGYVPIVYGPTALSHSAADKYARISNSVIRARRDPSDCTPDISETDDSLTIRRIAGVNKKAPSTPSGGRTGILLPLFASSRNGATFKSLIVNMNYPAIKGRLEVTDVTAINFGEACNGKMDRLFYTNPENEDITHPTHVKGLVAQNVSKEGYIMIGHPSTGKINPSDCVDMSCDGMRTVLLQVEDDGVYGNGNLFSKAEWQWDEEPVYGLGDYRIPKPMLTSTDGSRIDISTLATNGKGFARTDDCEYSDSTRAYSCTGDSRHTYRMLVIESLDADTETRRLSPLACLSDGYLNLYNGPQDHGWCAGYTCQKRISTFYTIVPVNMHTDIFFTSTPPKSFRLRLLNSEPGEKVTVGIWIPNPEKLDVYDETVGTYMSPLNAETPGDTNSVLKKPQYDGEYIPTASQNSNGDNFLDFDTRVLYICVDDVVMVNTTNAIYVTFGFPALSIDDFFGDEIVNNIANYLGINSDRIRRVNVVPENSRKKRDTTATQEFTVEVTAVSSTEANDLVNNMTTAFQQGNMSIGDVVAVTMGATRSDTEEDVASRDSALASGVVDSNVRVVTQPTQISLVTTPAGEELATLTTTPTVHLLDADNELVITDGTWTVQVALDTSHANSDSSATLSGTQEISFTNGVADFSDLSISHSGTYILSFTPSGSSSALSGITSTAFSVSERTIGATIQSLDDSSLTTAGSDLTFLLELTDGSENALTNINHKGLAYRVEITLDLPTGAASLSGTTLFNFDSAGQISATGLSLTGTTDYHMYNLKFRLFTNPSSNYDMTVGIQQIQIYPSNSADYIHEMSSNGVEVVMKFSETYIDVLGSNSIETVQSGFHNDMVSRYPDVYFSQFSMSSSSSGNLQFTTSITANNKTTVNNFLETFSNGGSLEYDSRIISLASTCSLTVDGTCHAGPTSDVVGDDNTTTIIVFAVLGTCIIVSLIIVATSYMIKRYEGSKVSAMRCMEASPVTSRATVSSMDSIHHSEWGRGSPDSRTAFRMTPVSE